MRQVFLDKGAITIKEVAEPVLDDSSVLVEVYYSCISPGTESATISHSQHNVVIGNIPKKITKVLLSIATNGLEGTRALIREKLHSNAQTLGYSCSGKVIAVGKKITKFRAGDLVACAGAGFAHHADIVCVPENLVVHVRSEQYLQQASVTTLGAIALQGIRRAQLQLGDTVCVVGLGLLGQLTVQLAKRSGCRVIGTDMLEERLQLARQHGADFVFNASDNIAKEIAAQTNHYGVDCTIITAASSSDSLMQQAMEITRKKGKVVIVGDVGLGMERSPLYQKEIDVLISCSYGPGRYDSAYEQQGIDYPYAYVRWTENRNMQAIVSLIENQQLSIDPLITEYASVEQADAVYDRIKEKKSLAAILLYEPHKATPEEQKVSSTSAQMSFVPATKSNVRVGIVGAGGFAKIKLIPIIANMKQVKINAIVDANVATSTNVSKLYQASRALTDDKKLFDEDLVDAVIIASPHKYHCDQALAALQHGKAVFLEKPMATTFDQLNRMQEFLVKNPSIPFCVDYNRSFAPFIRKIKSVIEQRSSPLVITYRMNAGFIPKDHWVQTEVGAGRIIGEACHIFDLFYYLTDAKPVAVSVETIRTAKDDLFPTDNFSAQISFSDGSLCTLVYTALGDNGLGKERMELFFDSKSIVMDDYKTLQGFGLPQSFNQTSLSPDKGHEFLLQQFFARLKSETFVPPIDHERLHRVAQLTLIIDQLACKGGGEMQLS